MNNYPYNTALPAALVAVTQPTFSFRFDQMVMMVLQQRKSGTNFANLAAMQTKANWDTLFAASDSTKFVVTPCFSGFVIPQSEPATQGGNSNETLFGIREYYNENSITATGMFRNLQPSSKTSMLALTQYSLMNPIGKTSLLAYLVNKDGYIFCNSNFEPIDTYNFRVGTTGSAGLNNANTASFSVDYPPQWDKDLICVKPTFDPISVFVAE